MTVQKLKPTLYSDFEAARSYLSVISVINKLGLRPMELDLMAYMAVKGSISNTNNKRVFCEIHKSTQLSVNNVIRRLKKKGLLEKVGGKVQLIKPISLDFKNPVIIKITFDAETRKTDNPGIYISENVAGTKV